MLTPHVADGTTVTKERLLLDARAAFQGGVTAADCPIWIASHIAVLFLGREWFDAYLADGNGLSDYLRWQDGSEREQANFHVRAFWLVNALYNLQNVPGFYHCIRQLQGDQVESAAFELQTARILYQAGIPFRLTGGTPDFEIDLRDGTKALAEAKCKLSRTDIGEQTIVNALEDARKDQLPKDGCNFIFLSIPAKYLHTSAHETIDKAVQRFFRGTGRVCSVKIVPSFSHLSEDRSGFEGYCYVKEIINPNSRLPFNSNWLLFENEAQTKRPWITVHQLAAEIIGPGV